MEEEIYVRLAPHAPQQGAYVKRYSYRGHIYVGGTRPTWYQVDRALAEELKRLKQIHSEPLSRSLFEVHNGEDKRRIESEEQNRALAAIGLAAGTVQNPQMVAPPPTHDLRSQAISTGDFRNGEGSGRAAAIPPPREHLRTETPAGYVGTEPTNAAQRDA